MTSSLAIQHRVQAEPSPKQQIAGSSPPHFTALVMRHGPSGRSRFAAPPLERISGAEPLGPDRRQLSGEHKPGPGFLEGRGLRRPVDHASLLPSWWLDASNRMAPTEAPTDVLVAAAIGVTIPLVAFRLCSQTK